MLDNFILLLIGLCGMVCINLIEIDKLNKASEANINLKRYVYKNWANMVLSVIIVLVSIVAKQFVQSLEAAGKSLFVGIFSIGMVGPTVAQFIRDKAVAFLTAMSPK